MISMRSTLALALNLIACALLICTCIALAVWLADMRGHSLSADRAMKATTEVMSKAEATNANIASIISKLSQYQDSDGVCSESSLNLMRELTASSIQVQAIGRMQGDRLLCSTLRGSYGDNVSLGPALATGNLGTTTRVMVSLPGIAGHKYVVLERAGVAVFVDQSVMLDVIRTAPDVPLGVFFRSTGIPISGRGVFRPEWAHALRGEAEATYFDGQYQVAMLSAPEMDVVAYAALPVARIQDNIDAALWVIVPAGGLLGLLMAVGLFILIRQITNRITGFRYALQSPQVFMQYQPIVDLRSGRFVGAEALIRWQSGERMVPPDRFIPAAEKAGFIELVTERVVQLVADDATAFLKQHPDFHISINLSAADLNSDRTVSMLTDMLDRTGLPAQSFWVEATERGFLEGGVVARVIDEIRTIGMRVAIDDFGTGYSSLAFLSSFSLDLLKIDKRFVDAIGRGGAGGQVVSVVIELAKSLGLEVVAEGVETEAQAHFLREHGVQYAQGWLFGRPNSIPALRELVTRNRPWTPEPGRMPLASGLAPATTTA
ncbi:EAL domain-containing protein [soil metagenome]